MIYLTNTIITELQLQWRESATLMSPGRVKATLIRINDHTEINHPTIAPLLMESFNKSINEGRLKRRTVSEEVVKLRDKNGGIIHE